MAATTPITSLLPGTVFASSDVLVFVDVSDHTQSPQGSTLKSTLTSFFAGIPVPVIVTSASATALAVGLTGATNPAFAVDASTALQVAGLKVTGAVSGGTVAVQVTDSGAAANLSLNAKGTGTIAIGSASTGRVTITPVTTITGALTLSAALTYGGVTLSNAVTGTGNMVLSASPTFTGTITAAVANFSGAVVVANSLTTSGASASVAVASRSGSGTTWTIYNPTGADLRFAASGEIVFSNAGAISGVTTYNGQTISSAASFTGTLATGGQITAIGGLTLNPAANPTITFSAASSALGYIDFTAASICHIYNSSAVAMATFNAGALTVAAGITATTGTYTGLIQTTITTEQLRLRYDATHYVSTTVDSLGNTTANIVGAGGITYAFNCNGTTALTFNESAISWAGTMVSPASTTSLAGIRLTQGVAPSSPVNGDMWQDGTNFKIRINGVTKTVTLT